MRQHWKAHLALFAVALIYGGNYTVARVAMGSGLLAPRAFVLMRIATALLLFLAIHALFVKERIERRDLGRLALCGFFGIFLNQTLFFEGLARTTPIHASLIMTTAPILVLLVSALLVGERITWPRVLGIALGCGGAVLLIAAKPGAGALGRASWLGDVMVFVNASSYAVYLVLVKRLLLRYQSFTVLKWVSLFGLLYMLPIGIPPLLATPFAAFSPALWWSVGYVLLFVSFFAYLFNAYALGSVSPSVVSAYIYLQPVLATLIAVLSREERMDGPKLLAAALIFAGVSLVSRRPRA